MHCVVFFPTLVRMWPAVGLPPAKRSLTGAVHSPLTFIENVGSRGSATCNGESDWFSFSLFHTSKDVASGGSATCEGNVELIRSFLVSHQ